MSTNKVGEVISSEVKTKSTCSGSPLNLSLETLLRCPRLDGELKVQDGFRLVPINPQQTREGALSLLFSGKL